MDRVETPMRVLEFNGWWRVSAATQGLEDILWIEERFGESNESKRWFFDGETQDFWFKDEKDALMYALTWS